MTTSVSIDQYCNNPSQYANDPGLTDQTKKYWNTICEARDELKNQKQTRTNFADGTGGGIQNFIMGMFTPDALKFLGAFTGGIIIVSQAKKAIVNWIKDGLSADLVKVAEDFARAGGDIEAANGTLVLDGIWRRMAFDQLIEGGEEVVGYSAGRYAVTALLKALEELGGILNALLIVQMVIQIIGMIFDSWDPCNLNVQLNKDLLKEYGDSFNQGFRSQVLQSIGTVQDSYGQVIETTTWPIEFYAERSVLIPIKKSYYDGVALRYAMHYINSLQYNSLGEPISWKSNARLINNNDLKQLENSIATALSDDNTVVANWFVRYWPVLLLLVIVLIVIFLFIKNRNVK